MRIGYLCVVIHGNSGDDRSNRSNSEDINIVGSHMFHVNWEANYTLLQYLAFGSLRVTKIHHLVKQLIDDDKVVPNTLLLELFKVLGEDLDDFVQEQEYLSGIGVALSEREEKEIIMTDIKILEFREQFGGKS
jgi:hypothetical protein